MKKFCFLAIAITLSTVCFAQKPAKYTEEDVNLICSTFQGTYKANDGDTAAMTLIIAPIAKNGDVNTFYAELAYDSLNAPLEQKVFDIVPVSSKVYKIIVHNIKDPNRFFRADKSRLNKITTSDYSGKKKHHFYRTKSSDFQTNWQSRKAFKSIKRGDRLHYKFSDEEGRFYVKRVPARTTRILGTTFVKQED